MRKLWKITKLSKILKIHWGFFAQTSEIRRNWRTNSAKSRSSELRLLAENLNPLKLSRLSSFEKEIFIFILLNWKRKRFFEIFLKISQAREIFHEERNFMKKFIKEVSKFKFHRDMFWLTQNVLRLNMYFEKDVNSQNVHFFRGLKTLDNKGEKFSSLDFFFEFWKIERKRRKK